MSAKELSNEKNIVSVEITVSAEDFQKAIKQSYNKNKKYFTVQGFRKGKAPRKLIEAHYGKGVFYEDAIDFAFPGAYKDALEELKIEPVTRPELQEVKEASEDGAVFIVNIGLKPAATLGEYKGAEIESLEAVITDEDIDAEITRMAGMNARIITDENAEAKKGDTVIIDFVGSIDGVPFDGGAGRDYTLELGSNVFVPGFEDQLVGAKAGEEIDVKVTFPEDYHQEDVAGKDAVFKTTIKEVQVKELPEIDDEFAKDVSEFDTLDELKVSVAEKLKEQKTTELRRSAENKVIDFAVQNAEIEIPYLMVEEELDRTLDTYDRQLSSQGLSLNDYLGYMGSNVEQFREGMKADVERNIKADFVLTEIAETEKLEPTEEELEEEIKRYAASMQQDFEEFKKTVNETMESYMKTDIKRRKAIDFLVDAAQVK
ncbi:trigger factor [Eubacterium maltosivorans]|uniref:trigger factor n=1 Tax=Eubacterium maltosivorans TaxID=2041044 RepID=UPI00088CF3A0|nr:trigger factor [Eubacterium maltosivorans]WPK81116.1 Trigger factor [Eubacterium maltosivorans]SDO70312.1 trigger factor [Eubacterium maltosivorans]